MRNIRNYPHPLLLARAHSSAVMRWRPSLQVATARSWLGAAALELALSTVRNHAQRLLEKLGVHSRAEAVRRARRRGWI